MRRTIIGQDGLIDVEHIANMLRSLALPQIDIRNVNWWSKAEQEIEDAKKEAAKNGGSIASEEQIFMRIFERAVAERGTLARVLSDAQETLRKSSGHAGHVLTEIETRDFSKRLIQNLITAFDRGERAPAALKHAALHGVYVSHVER